MGSPADWPDYSNVSYELLDARWLSPAVKRLVIRAPHVTRNCQAGQFVIVRAVADGERIPLTIADSDREAGTIVLIVQVVGATTALMTRKKAGESLSDVAGPMGKPTDIEQCGHAIVVGGGVGTAVIYPQAKALKSIGNKVSAIIGGRTRELIILEPELSELCDAVYPCTDDGSYGFAGLVTQRLDLLLRETADAVGMVLCAGPVPMMGAVAEITRPLGIRTIASLNPIMVDGTGMCGGCRVRLNGETKFACVEGPEFDAHKVDFRELVDRLSAYREFEKCAMEKVR
jgi:ferredoxin--NADP+ reductase